MCITITHTVSLVIVLSNNNELHSGFYQLLYAHYMECRSRYFDDEYTLPFPLFTFSPIVKEVRSYKDLRPTSPRVSSHSAQKSIWKHAMQKMRFTNVWIGISLTGRGERREGRGEGRREIATHFLTAPPHGPHAETQCLRTESPSDVLEEPLPISAS